MLQRLQFSIFKLRLAVHLIVFCFELARPTFRKYRLYAAAAILLMFSFILSLLLYLSTPKPPPAKLLFDAPATKSELFMQRQLHREEIEAELKYWLQLEEIQPTHRDVLINISQLYRALGEENQATYYWEQARKLDPNHPIFKSAE